MCRNLSVYDNALIYFWIHREILCITKTHLYSEKKFLIVFAKVVRINSEPPACEKHNVICIMYACLNACLQKCVYMYVYVLHDISMNVFNFITETVTDYKNTIIYSFSVTWIWLYNFLLISFDMCNNYNLFYVYKRTSPFKKRRLHDNNRGWKGNWKGTN